MKTIIPELSQLEDLDMNYILPILKESKIPESVIEDNVTILLEKSHIDYMLICLLLLTMVLF